MQQITIAEFADKLCKTLKFSTLLEENKSRKFGVTTDDTKEIEGLDIKSLKTYLSHLSDNTKTIYVWSSQQTLPYIHCFEKVTLDKNKRVHLFFGQDLSDQELEPKEGRLTEGVFLVYTPSRIPFAKWVKNPKNKTVAKNYFINLPKKLEKPEEVSFFKSNLDKLSGQLSLSKSFP